ncbi:MAG: SMI1/KNR4 family protein [Ginsengibacter sp.]
MLFKKVLYIIQSRRLQEEWYSAVTNAALYLAIGGFLETANKLLEALWKYNLPHDRNTWLHDKAFEILWYAKGERPKKVPFKKINIDELELLHRDYISPSWAQYANSIEGNPFLQAMSLAKTINEKLPNNQTEKKALAYLKKYFQDLEEESTGYHTCQAISLTTELAAKNKETNFSIKFLKQWAKSFNKQPFHNCQVLVGCNRHVAPLLLNGIIKNEIGLTKEICGDFLTNAVAAIDRRMKNGVSLVYGDLTWEKLISKLSELSIKIEPKDFTAKQKKENWIGKQPSSEFTIARSEQRLGIQLPNEYREFLKASNGLSPFPYKNPELIAIEKIDYLKKSYFDLYGDLDLFPCDFLTEDGQGDISKYIERAIAISLLPDEQEIWLIPPKLNNDEWECWFFASWLPGVRQYKNFRYFIEEQVQNLEGE